VERADLLLEVVDAADPSFIGQQQAVQTVLDELGAGDKPRITVFNKIDLLDADLRSGPIPAAPDTAFVSAVTGEGLDELREQIGDLLRRQMERVDAVVPYARGELVARARRSGEVDEAYTDAGIRLSGRLPAAIAAEVRSAGAATNGRSRSGT
jgi:GTP-binding protein HflX